MLILSPNQKYPPFPLLSYFSVVVCLRCLLHHIMLLIAYTFRENREFVFFIIVQFMMSANSQIRFDLKIVFVYLYITSSHYHHYASLSEDIELIKCLSDIVCRVCEWDKAYSLSYPLQNTWDCVFSVDPFPSSWPISLAQKIELTEISDAHLASLQWTYFLRNISFSAPEGLSDRISLSMGKRVC